MDMFCLFCPTISVCVIPCLIQISMNAATTATIVTRMQPVSIPRDTLIAAVGQDLQETGAIVQVNFAIAVLSYLNVVVVELSEIRP